MSPNAWTQLLEVAESLLVVLPDRRWYMFQNMGPAPSVRSGHALAAFGRNVMVLGGESNAAFQQARPDDPSVIHVLDTGEFEWLALIVNISDRSDIYRQNQISR